MRLKSFNVRGFRSLRDLPLADIPNLVILVGKNGSGKSNILEALEFFFAHANFGGDQTVSVSNELRYGRTSAQTIEFEAALELSSMEIRGIQRHLPNTIASKGAAETHQVAVSYHVDSSKVKGATAAIDGTVAVEGGKVLPISDDAKKGKDFPLSNEAIASIVERLNNQMRHAFRFIRGPPEETGGRVAAGQKQQFLSGDSINAIAGLSQAADHDSMARWDQYEFGYAQVTGRSIASGGGVVGHREHGTFLPLQCAGSGDQSIAGLQRHLANPNPIVAFEEPESHLHASYVRNLAEIFSKRAGSGTQILITTHSTIFVDKSKPNHVWHVRSADGATLVRKLTLEGLKDLVNDLGVKPSDFLFSNRVLFIEGDSENELLPIAAELLGCRTDDKKIVNLRGKSNAKPNLTVWLRAAAESSTEVRLLLDGDARQDLEDVVRAGLIQRAHAMLLERDGPQGVIPLAIEDFYSEDGLRSLVEEYGRVELGRDGLGKLNLSMESSRVKQIDSYLRFKDWKIPIARRVRSSMTKESAKSCFGAILEFLYGPS